MLANTDPNIFETNFLLSVNSYLFAFQFIWTTKWHCHQNNRYKYTISFCLLYLSLISIRSSWLWINHYKPTIFWSFLAFKIVLHDRYLDKLNYVNFSFQGKDSVLITNTSKTVKLKANIVHTTLYSYGWHFTFFWLFWLINLSKNVLLQKAHWFV